MKMKQYHVHKIFMIVSALLMICGCLRQSSDIAVTTTTGIDWSKIEVRQTISTTTTAIETNETTSTTSTTLEIDYKTRYETLLRAKQTAPVTTSTSDTTITTTTTTVTAYKISSPAIVPIKLKWTACKFDRDCMIVEDCCGIKYGNRYAITSGYNTEYHTALQAFCQPQSRRTGCSQTANQNLHAACITNKCTLV